MTEGQLTAGPAAKIDDHHDDLADLADSDLPCSEIAEQLLEIADSQT